MKLKIFCLVVNIWGVLFSVYDAEHLTLISVIRAALVICIYSTFRIANFYFFLLTEFYNNEAYIVIICTEIIHLKLH